MHGKRRMPARFGDTRNGKRVSVRGSVPVRILSVTGTSTARTTASTIARDQRTRSRAAREPAAALQHLLRRAAHVDVDDLGAARDVVLRGVGHQRGIGPGDLHGNGAHFAAMIGAPLRFLGAPQSRIRRDHLRHRVARAVALAELPEWTIGDPRHRCDDKVVRKNVRADLHGNRIEWSRNRRRGERIITVLRAMRSDETNVFARGQTFDNVARFLSPAT